jgi:hypothetical protein
VNRSRVLRIVVVALIGLAVTFVVKALDRPCAGAPKDGPGVTRVDLGAQVLSVAAGPRGLWAVRRLYGGIRPYDLVELDPSSGRIVGQPIPLPGYATALEVGEDAVWFVTSAVERRPRGFLNRVDPRSHRVTSRLVVGRGTSSVSIGNDGIWVTNVGNNNVVRVDPTGRRILAKIRVSDGPVSVLARSGALWVGTSYGRPVVRKLDPATGQQIGEVEGSIATVTSDAVWVVRSGPPNGQLVRLNPSTLRRVGPIVGLDRPGAAVAVAGRDVWVGTYFPFCSPTPAPFGNAAFGWFRVDAATLRPLSGPVFSGASENPPPVGAFAAGALWMRPELGNEVIRIDLATAAKARPPADVPVVRSEKDMRRMRL